MFEGHYSARCDSRDKSRRTEDVIEAAMTALIGGGFVEAMAVTVDISQIELRGDFGKLAGIFSKYFIEVSR